MRIHRPSAPEEAYKLRKEIAGSAYLLGGTTVLTLGNEFEDLIDINGFISGAITAEGSNVVIGAGAKLEDVASSGLVPSVIRTAASSCPSLQQRNMATIGGNAASCRADGYMTAALLAASASVLVYDGSSARSMSYCDYIKNHEPEWIVLSISVDSNADGTVKRISRASHMHAVVTAAMCGDNYAYTAMPSTIISGSSDCYKDMVLESDTLGSAEYKRYLLSVIFEEGNDGNKS